MLSLVHSFKLCVPRRESATLLFELIPTLTSGVLVGTQEMFIEN